MVAASSNAAAARHRVWAMVSSNPTRNFAGRIAKLFLGQGDIVARAKWSR
jgi:hypothetical protein